MTSTLNDYRRELEGLRMELHRELASGTILHYENIGRKVLPNKGKCFEITVIRKAIELMEEDLRNPNQQKNTMNLYEHVSRNDPGTRGPFLWRFSKIKEAEKSFMEYEPTNTEIVQKLKEYQEKVDSLLKDVFVNTKTFLNSSGGCPKSYFIEPKFIMEEGKEGKTKQIAMELVKQIKFAVLNWVINNCFNRNLYKMPVVNGIATALEERQELVLLISTVQALGTNVVEYEPQIEVSLGDELAAFIMSCIPYVGNALTLLDAYEGRDAFCRNLSLTERILTSITVGLPFIKLLAKGGKAVYTASRLAQLYGREAKVWSMMIQMGERATAQPDVAKALFEARIMVREGKKLSPQILKKAEYSLSKIMEKNGAKSIVYSNEEQIFEKLRRLISVKPQLKNLDEFALKRVAEKTEGTTEQRINAAKGRLMEELFESLVTPLMRDPFGVSALFKGGEKVKKIIYLPGHILTTGVVKGEITDGMFVLIHPKAEIKPVWFGSRTSEEISRIKGLIEVWGVVECKAGNVKSSAKGLKYEYDLTRRDREAIKAAAQEIMTGKSVKNRAQYLYTLSEKDRNDIKSILIKQGKPFTLENIEEEIKKKYKIGELGGQIRMDLERLDEFEDGSLPRIFVGDEEYLVKLRSFTKTKMFGVLTRDVRSQEIVKKLTDPVKVGGEGLNFEVIGINITQKELRELAIDVLKMASEKKW